MNTMSETRARGGRKPPRGPKLWVPLMIAAAVALTYATPLYEPFMFDDRGAKPVLTLTDANEPSISADGARLAVKPEIGVTEVYDVAAGRKLQTFRLPGSAGHSISADGRRVAIFGDAPLPSEGRYTKSESVVWFYDVEGGQQLARVPADVRWNDLRLSALKVYGGAGEGTENISSDLRYVANAAFRQEKDHPPGMPGIVLGASESGEIVRSFGSYDDWFDQWQKLRLTPDAAVLAATRTNSRRPERGATVVWDAKSGRELLRLPFAATWLALSADGRRLATMRDTSAGAGGAVSFTVDALGQVQAHTAPGTPQRASGDSRPPVIELWDVATGRRVAEVGAAYGNKRPPAVAGAFSPDGKLLATASYNYVLLWDAATGRLLAAQPHVSDPERDVVKTVSFSDNGQFLVMGSRNEVVKVWRLGDVLKDARAQEGAFKIELWS